MNNEYVEQTEDVCNAVLNLLEPEAEMLAKRQMNDQMKAHLINLSTQMDYLEGFLRLAKKAHGFTSTSFGISNLRKASNNSDFEGIVANFKIVCANVSVHSTILKENGMSDTFEATLTALLASITADRQKQFEILSKRSAIVQDNVQKLNDLYGRLTEIYTIGKAIYKNSNPVKLTKYTFSELLKKVRREAKAKDLPVEIKLT